MYVDQFQHRVFYSHIFATFDFVFFAEEMCSNLLQNKIKSDATVQNDS